MAVYKITETEIIFFPSLSLSVCSHLIHIQPHSVPETVPIVLGPALPPMGPIGNCYALMLMLKIKHELRRRRRKKKEICFLLFLLFVWCHTLTAGVVLLSSTLSF